jgi:SNF2 family DNA or RNA helicase
MIQTRIKWALTATPVMNRMMDLVNILGWVGIDSNVCQCEKDTITSLFILRRTKDDVKKTNKILELPPCHTEIKYIPFENTEEAELYMKIFMKEKKKLMCNDVNVNNITYLLEHLLRIRQICIHPELYYDGVCKKFGLKKRQLKHVLPSSVTSTKNNALVRCIDEQPHDDKTIVFCQFVQEMDLVIRDLELNGSNCVRLDGTMTMEDRNHAVETFKKDPDVNVFVIQINTGGQGINLQIANRIYIMSPNWNPAVEHQAIGRSYRTGQTKKVYVTKFCISSGDKDIPFIEENIIKLQEKKKKIISQMLNDERIENDGTKYLNNVPTITANEIRKLFNIYNEME